MFFRKQKRIQELENKLKEQEHLYGDIIDSYIFLKNRYQVRLKLMPYIIGDAVNVLYHHSTERINRLNAEILRKITFVESEAERLYPHNERLQAEAIRTYIMKYATRMTAKGIETAKCCKPYADKLDSDILGKSGDRDGENEAPVYEATTCAAVAEE